MITFPNCHWKRCIPMFRGAFSTIYISLMMVIIIDTYSKFIFFIFSGMWKYSLICTSFTGKWWSFGERAKLNFLIKRCTLVSLCVVGNLLYFAKQILVLRHLFRSLKGMSYLCKVSHPVQYWPHGLSTPLPIFHQLMEILGICTFRHNISRRESV